MSGISLGEDDAQAIAYALNQAMTSQGSLQMLLRNLDIYGLYWKEIFDTTKRRW